MLWLGVHLPLLPLEIQGGTAEAPTVVIDDRGRILLRNTAAVAAGIAAGSTLATAHSILPGVAHHRRSPERERQRQALLAEALYGFSARVSLAPPAADGDPTAGVMLEIGGSLKLFGDAALLARQAAELCRGMGHEVRVRWAATPLAALVLARSDAASLKLVPLRHAAVEPQRLTAERVERFANMGIHTLGQLLALPSRGLAQRFGEDLVDYLARLTGERPDPRPCIQPAEHFRADLHLLEPLNSKEALAFPMQRLLTDLEHWLRARQLGSEQLHWHFTGSGSDSRPGGPRNGFMPVRFARAQQSREAFLDITRLQLAEAALPEDVIGLALEARRLTPWSSGSRGLFGSLPGLQSAEEAHELGELVDQLRARLGPDACYTLEVKDQHTPERAWSRALPLRHGRTASSKRPNAPARKEQGPQEDQAARPLKRPLWLFDPPRPVDPGQLVLLEGPERIHTGWWLADDLREAAPGHARDYYVARHRGGAQCWVFTDPWERWYLHGYFS